MQFRLTIVFIILYYIRPFEFLPVLRNVRVMFFMGIIAAIPLLNNILNGRIKLFRNGVDQLMLGFVLAIILSHIRHLYFGGAIGSVKGFWPTFIAFYIIIHSLNNERYIDTFVNVIVLCSTYLAIEGIVQAHTGTTLLGDVEPLLQRYRDEFGELFHIIRIKWTGPLMDPNDLALAYVLVVPFLLEKIMGKRKLFATVALVLLFYAIFLTNSRGGMLALLFAIGSYFILRYKSFKGAMACAVFAFAIFILGPSRMAELSSSEESAQGRLMAWYHGFQMFKMAPIFGVGHNLYTNFHAQVAHNSYIHVLGELGLFGLYFFVGLFYLPFKITFSLLIDPNANIPDKIRGQLNAGLASMIGLLMAMFFLSRSYILMPYLIVAYVVSLLVYVRDELPENNVSFKVFPAFSRQIIAVCLAIIIYVNIIVKLLL